MERRQDIFLGLIFMGVGAAAAWMARSYSGEGGTYPMVLGILLALLGSAVAGKALRSGAYVDRQLIEAPTKMVTAAAACTVYIALVAPLGFYTSSFLLMLMLPAALGFRQWLYAVIVALVFTLVVFLVFSVLLEKPLPRETLLSLLSTGG
ncbi:tripartite tricarboxylate transporter TctB family protein [uncultured Roseibium sp.]|uniref:tripartite tricarboxylate transporter TctB family protein n=1 Tax=uncultured Roseibium sp. TaxID=1936171 RepID=UPI002609A75C|nr:tripartite tricarboxylate transporter TctB family protein [uncultured Roseibium sp.]